MTLYECAHKLGVPIYYEDVGRHAAPGAAINPFRPDLEIAHDLLAKLQTPLELQWVGPKDWRVVRETDFADSEVLMVGTFIEAVIALCERANP